LIIRFTTLYLSTAKLVRGPEATVLAAEASPGSTKIYKRLLLKGASVSPLSRETVIE